MRIGVIISDEPRINDEIRVSQVRLIGPNGEQVGVIATSVALNLAKEANLDLVEVAPNAKPPVAKLIDYGKYKYNEKIKAREARRNQSTAEIKEIRFRLKIDDHDFEVKKGHVVRFLNGGDKVKVTIMLRGREQSRPIGGVELLQRLASEVEEYGTVEFAPKQEGRNIIMTLAPKGKKVHTQSEQRRRGDQSRAERQARQAARLAAKQEAQAAAGLSSPYIVGVYDWGKDGDTYYIVMEYLRGTDLKSGIKSHGALDPKKVAQIGSQISSALSVAHKHEIIHRDIKPQNIMVLPDGNIKVMDFGIARAKNSHLTQDNNVLGTAHYVSPEQTRGQDLGPTSDIYSLGVVMYECATGRVPFDGDDAISVALKQVNELPIPPSQINSGVDADLERIILKCMEKDPANRFQTADELRQVLNSYLSGRTVNVSEPTRIIGAAGDLGATKTRELSDSTRAMVRPVSGVSGQNTARSAVSGSTGSYEVEKPKSNKNKIIAAVIAAVAVIGVVVAFATGMFSGEQVTVPDVLGKDQETAIELIKEAGLEVGTVDQSYNDDVDEGKVAEQTPNGNTKKAKGTRVNLVVSKGPKPSEKVEVPQLVGLTKDQAEAALASVGLKGSASEEANEAEEGQVFEQSTVAGKEVEKGTTISYKVSSGPDTTSVPDLTDMTEAQARNALDMAGFGVDVSYQENDSVTEGTVISWNPSGKQKPGATITVVIAKKSGKASVPGNLYGKSISAAVTALNNAGFYNIAFCDQNGNPVSGNENATVTGVSPTGKQSTDSTITLTVSISGSGDDSESSN